MSTKLQAIQEHSIGHLKNERRTNTDVVEDHFYWSKQHQYL